MKMTISVGRCLKRKSMLVWIKEYITKTLQLQKSLQLARTIYCFQRKHPNVNIGFSKFCALRPKWLVLTGSKIFHSVCVCSVHQNVMLLVDAMDWDLTYKDLIKKIVCNTESNKCIMHWCESCPGTATLKEFLDQVLNEHEDDEKRNYCQWDTTNRAILTNFTTTYEEHKETLIVVIDDLTRHSYIANLNITSCWYRTKSKTTTGVKITARCIPWLYTTCHQMVTSNMIRCALVLMIATITQAFYIKFKQCLFIILKLVTGI